MNTLYVAVPSTCACCTLTRQVIPGTNGFPYMYFPAAVSRLSARGLETMGGGNQEDKGTLHSAEEGTCACILSVCVYKSIFTHYSSVWKPFSRSLISLSLSLSLSLHHHAVEVSLDVTLNNPQSLAEDVSTTPHIVLSLSYKQQYSKRVCSWAELVSALYILHT